MRNKSIFFKVVIVIFSTVCFYSCKGDKDKVEKNNIKNNTTPLQIDVQNGTEKTGLENKLKNYLDSKGFNVVETGQFSTNDVKTTMVIDRAGNIENAKRVALSLGISDKFVIQQINKNYVLDATVVIGQDYQTLIPFKNDKDKTPNNNSGKTQRNSILADDLLDEYKSNQLRADEKFLNKNIQIEGIIYKISKPVKDIVIEIHSEKNDFLPINCALLESEKQKAQQLSKGDWVTLNGKCYGKPEGYNMIFFVNCKIVSFQ